MKKGLVPKLRFPEFQNEQDWKKIKFIETVDKKIKWSFIGGPFGSNLKSSDYTDNSGVRIIQLQNIGDAEFFDEYKIFTSEEKADELLSCNIYPNDIILSKMGDPVGRACLIPNNHERYVMCSDGIRLVVDENTHNKYFIYSLINSVQFRALVEKTATGSTRKRIGLDDLKNLPITVPKVNEQTKIAACLSSLDDLITAQTQKIAALKTHKKGLMQQLFPAEGETVPKLRFPEFRDSGEWEEKPLNAVLDYERPDKYIVSDTNYLKNGIPVLTANKSFILGYTNEEQGIFDNIPVIIFDDFTVDTKYVDFKFKVKSSAIKILKIKGKNNLKVIFELMNQIKFEAPEHKRYYISEFQNLIVKLPKFEEQQKIAACLSSLDELINAQIKKCEALKLHKKGLMQGLFPSSDETA